ncbi:MerR family transcriptional regulator [Streptomyces stelliscabiei]|uniref:MerR family transcriptional regulator n=1 Tax=Streptomyces stelliscabiei TaxID=146820 RepID=UPI0029B40DC7|nr:MerR family transcriptional regulator [Streptomyces stelliscabiei]MDX2667407.1 MerR family transcriptional regulator [Streptomyces stelliscabiei]MDX2785946.1 MerR family transcriptional regulator [Streptomyces stelliscabiei]
MSELYNGTQAAALATKWRRTVTADAAAVSRSAICKWVERGHLQPAGLDEQQRPLYALADLARAEKATRARALRLVSAGRTQGSPG